MAVASGMESELYPRVVSLFAVCFVCWWHLQWSPRLWHKRLCDGVLPVLPESFEYQLEWVEAALVTCVEMGGRIGLDAQFIHQRFGQDPHKSILQMRKLGM